MRHARIAMPTAPQMRANFQRDNGADASRGSIFPSPKAGSGAALNWVVALLAAALVIAVLGYGISFVYPLMFKT